MARIPGAEAREAGWLARIVYRMVRRKVGRVVLPFQIAAHNPPLFRSVAFMEMGQQSARTVNLRVKALAQLKAATLIGCPF